MSPVLPEHIDRAAVGMALAVVLAAVALAFPWWTSTSGLTSGGFQITAGSQAGPFYAEDGLVAAWNVVLTGLLALVGLVAFLVGFLSLTEYMELHPAWEAGVPTLVYVGAGALLVALAVAVVTWPGGDAGFWDEPAAQGSGGSAGTTNAAGIGWYAGLVAGLVGPVAMWDARSRGLVSGKEGNPGARMGAA